MQEPHTLTATEAADLIRQGKLKAEKLVASCLARIKAREPVVDAWAYLDPDRALAQAKALDRGAIQGPLHGIPIGVKDIIDTADMPTAYGSPIYRDHRSGWDAACVAVARAAGAIILGKTVTSEFALYHAGKTKNPHDPARSPGISSMGSAAAVADRMVPLAFGTQTGASILKPATFCGAIGYKPSFGTFNRTGVHPAADSLDTLGHFARSIDDVALFGTVLSGRPDFGAGRMERAPRIGLCRTAEWAKADAAMKTALEEAAARLAKAGAAVQEIELPDPCRGLNEACLVIMRYESARALAHEYRVWPDGLSERLRGVIAQGLAYSHDHYLEAVTLAQRCRALVAPIFEQVDLLMTPPSECEAPLIKDVIGDSVFNRLWTLLHLPCLAFPTGKSAYGLPVAVQLVGSMHGDDALLRAARWVEAQYA
jgi:Asp-tRNA(Asn)/Glu-tRNA(Gln) amidotransferase A subunit family amidase